MKAMQHDSSGTAIAWTIGIISGCLAYLKASLLFIDLNGMEEKILSLLWAVFVAFVCGAASVAGKKFIERFFKRKRK